MNGQSRRECAAMLLALGMLIAPHAAAQPADASSSNVGRFYAFGGLAVFAPDKDGQLRNQQGNLANVIAGGGLRASQLFSIEAGLLAFGQKLDTPAATTPPGGTFQPGSLSTRMGTLGVNLTAKLQFAMDRLEPYFGAGVGIYSTRIRTTSEAVGCAQNCGDTGPRITANSRDAGYHALVGADYHITQKDVVGVEFRQLWLDASFDEVGMGKVKAGGSLLWMGYRRYF
ncbi:MAG TPA: outer membrane beta-barrel protein [Burkholderiales bacterium]|nr:outer membrane beta-barrel protein [Burkholderiales bacterium]